MKKHIIIYISILILFSCSAKKKSLDKIKTSTNIEHVEKETVDKITVTKKDIKNLIGKIIVYDSTLPVSIKINDNEIIFNNAKEINFGLSHEVEGKEEKTVSEKGTETNVAIDEDSKQFDKTVIRPDIVVFIVLILVSAVLGYFIFRKKIL